MLDIGLNVLGKISSFGYKAYIVGGYPRDLYLNRSTTDIDICTDATPMEIVNIFKEVVTSSTEYGNVIIIYNKIRFEITTFRVDGKYNDFRKPSSIQYTSSLEEDLKRRDFTINTLCIDKDGKQIDLLNAKSDLDNKIIRMIGNPKIRLKEDALRILRAVRLATVLDFQLEPVLKAYMKKYGCLLRKISKNRQKEELDLIFASTNKDIGIKLLCELKLNEYLDLTNLPKIKITPSMIVTWASLNVLDKFNFNSNERESIIQISHLQNKDLCDKKILYKYGLYICTLASELTGQDKQEINIAYASMQIHSKLDIAIKPTEICKLLNKEPGSFLKEIIADLENKLLEDKLHNEYQELENYITRTYKK